VDGKFPVQSLKMKKIGLMKVTAPMKADFKRFPVAAVQDMARINTFLKAFSSGAIGELQQNT
jgi:hypothetical protein